MMTTSPIRRKSSFESEKAKPHPLKNFWQNMAPDCEKHVIRFLPVRDLVNLSKVSRSLKKISCLDEFWRPLLQQKFPEQTQATSSRQLFIKFYTDAHVKQRKEAIEKQSRKCSMRFTWLNILPPTSSLLSVLLETSDRIRIQASGMASLLSLTSIATTALIEECRLTNPTVNRDDECLSRIFHATLGSFHLVSIALNFTATPITSCISFYNASFHFLKAAPEQCAPNLCTKVTLGLNAVWQAITRRCGKRAFCYRSERPLSKDL